MRYASRQAVCCLSKEVKIAFNMSPNLLGAPLAHIHDQILLDHNIPQEVAFQPPQRAAYKKRATVKKFCIYHISYPLDQSNPLVGFDTLGIEYAPKMNTAKRMTKVPRNITMLSGWLPQLCWRLLDTDKVQFFMTGNIH